MRRRDQIRALGYDIYELLRKIGATPDEVAARAATAEAKLTADLEELRQMRHESDRAWNELQDQRHQNDLNVIKRQQEHSPSDRGLRIAYRRLYRRWVRRNG